MYEYKRVEVKVGDSVNMDKYIEEGWVYIGTVPKHSTVNSDLSLVDLVFERKKEVGMKLADM